MSQYTPQIIMRRSKKIVRKYKKSLAPRLRWTPQLHHLFIQSVENLGGRNKATPKRIVQMMAIKELKISHVKSHLQSFNNEPDSLIMSGGMMRFKFKIVMYRNMREHPSLHLMIPDFNLSSRLHMHAQKSSKQKESGSQNGENIHYNKYQEAEGSISSGMTKEEEEEEDDEYCEKERKLFNLDSTRETSTHINLDLSLS